MTLYKRHDVNATLYLSAGSILSEVLEKARTKTFHGKETIELRSSISACSILAATNSSKCKVHSLYLKH